MAQEDQTQKCSNSSSGGGGGGGGGGGSGVNIATFCRSSKKLKQKKVPQRGLGVAQLEKIRLEEQQKKDAASILPSPSTNVSPPTKPSFLSVSIPNYHPSNQSSSIPFPSRPPTTDLSSPNSIYRTPQLVQNTDMVNTNNVSLTNPLGWSSISGHDNVPKLWSSCEFNCEKENSGVDSGLAFPSNLELPYEFNPIWPLPGLVKRAQQYQQPSSSMVHVSSASSSSSVLNYQMEPPSNQSCHGKYTPLWPEEEKMVGIKRPYPFSLDNPPGPSFNYKFPRISSRSDESASCVNGGTFNFEPGNTNFRDGPSCSTSILEPNSKKSIKENGVFYGEFLTLAPPTTTLTSSSSKFKHPSTNLAFYNSRILDFESLPYQGSMDDPILRAGSSGLNQQQQQPYYSFLPPAMVHVGQSKTVMNNCNGGEVGGSIDLNLKL